MERTGFNGYVYDFSVDHDAFSVDNIKDIRKYVMKKNNIVWYVRKNMFGFIKGIFLTDFLTDQA